MHRLFAFLLILVAGLGQLALADPIQDTAQSYLRRQTQGLPGTVTITVGSLAPGTQLPPCERLEAFTPAGSKLWGKTHIGVRCLAPNPWSVLLSAQVSVLGNYVTVARPLAGGTLITAGDISLQQGDLANLPTGLVSAPEQAIGKTLRNPLAAGQPLRQDQLLAPLVIRQGQTVMVVSRGNGFSVSSEGKAIGNASSGQVVQIRMPSGQTISGIAKDDGSAEISQ